MTTPNKLTAVSLMSAFALAVVASGTVAAPASVSVSLGPALKEKGATTYGVAEVGRPRRRSAGFGWSAPLLVAGVILTRRSFWS